MNNFLIFILFLWFNTLDNGVKSETIGQSEPQLFSDIETGLENSGLSDNAVQKIESSLEELKSMDSGFEYADHIVSLGEKVVGCINTFGNSNSGTSDYVKALMDLVGSMLSMSSGFIPVAGPILQAVLQVGGGIITLILSGGSTGDDVLTISSIQSLFDEAQMDEFESILGIAKTQYKNAQRDIDLITNRNENEKCFSSLEIRLFGDVINERGIDFFGWLNHHVADLFEEEREDDILKILDFTTQLYTIRVSTLQQIHALSKNQIDCDWKSKHPSFDSRIDVEIEETIENVANIMKYLIEPDLIHPHEEIIANILRHLQVNPNEGTALRIQNWLSSYRLIKSYFSKRPRYVFSFVAQGTQNWGEWHDDFKECNDGEFINTMKWWLDKDQVDNAGINYIEFSCGDDYNTVYGFGNSDHKWGDETYYWCNNWRTTYMDWAATFVPNYQQDHEGETNRPLLDAGYPFNPNHYDEVGINGFGIACTESYALDSSDWKETYNTESPTPWIKCPKQSYLCAMNVRYEIHTAFTDDTGINDIIFICCSSEE